MTDEELDQILTGAGARWRAANTGVATVDPASVGSEVIPLQYEDDVAPPAARRRLWPWLIAAAAAAVLAVGISLVVTVPGGSDQTAGSALVPYASWNLVSFGLDDSSGTLVNQAVTGASFHLQITKGTHSNGDGSSIVADIGCGTTSGAVDVFHNPDGRSGGLTFGDLATAAVGCTKAVAAGPALDDVFMPTPGNDPHQALWRMSGGDLVLDGSGAELIYAPATGTHTAPALLGTSWKLANFTDTAGKTSSDVEQAALTITAGGTYIGSDGCNNVGGTVDVTGGAVSRNGDATGKATFHPAAQTAIGCPSAVTFEEVLGGEAPAAWQIYGSGKLAVTRNGVGSLVFVSAEPTVPASSASQLSGTKWSLYSYCNGNTCGTVSHATVGTVPDLAFDHATITGNNGCSTAFQGTYALERATMTTQVTWNSPGGSSVSQCADPPPPVYAILTAKKITWSVTSESLQLSADGSVLKYVPYASPPASSSSPPSSPTTLVGRTWLIDAVEHAGSASTTYGWVSSAVAARLSFSSAGEVSGTNGCQSFRGKAVFGMDDATVEINSLKLSAGPACPASTPIVPTVSDGTWTVKNSGGFLYLAKGSLTLVYDPAERRVAAESQVESSAP
ncbi:MAG TPA: META domain-containing protein [Jatrophihabitans sp.]|jgi:heat shock protein HslJ